MLPLNEHPPLRWSHKRLMREYDKQGHKIAQLKKQIDQLECLLVEKIREAAEAYQETHEDD